MFPLLVRHCSFKYFFIVSPYFPYTYSKFYKILIELQIFRSAERIKRDLDSWMGHPWHVIVGESFDFSIEYDSQYCYYFFYGPIAVLAYKVRSTR